MDCGLRTGYKIWTRYKTRTGKYGLGMKHGLGIKRGLENMDWYKIEILGGGSFNQEPDKKRYLLHPF